MRKIGTLLCLLPLISIGGWLSAPAPVSNPADRATLANMLTQATAMRRQGDYTKAAQLFTAGQAEARRRRRPDFEARFLWGIANCHFSRHRYREALNGYLEARDAFVRLRDPASTSALNGSLASLYSQLGEFDAAIDSVKRALDDDSARDSNGRRARLLVLLATLVAGEGKIDEAAALFSEAIREADRFDDAELQSNAWDRLGSELLMRKRLPEAEDALFEGFRIRKLNHLPSLAGSYRNVGLLRLEQGDLRSAAALLDASVAESRSGSGRIPDWRFYHARGRLKLSEGKLERAYEDFRATLELARNYRLTAPPSDATRVSVEGLLQEVYTSFVETAARLYFETGRKNLAREAFEALEENRSGSLTARSLERRQFRRNMGPDYWTAAAKLQSAETAALTERSDAARDEMRTLRRSMIEMEARAGGVGLTPRADLLARLQGALDGDTLLLSFHLGAESSLLWSVSDAGVSLLRLPGRDTVAAEVRRFRDAALARDSSTDRRGRELYGMLFGGGAPEYRSKRRWLLSLDDGLFDAPFPALMDGSAYLIERHSLRIVSGAANWLEAPKPSKIAGSFVGVGDAIYNAADDRWSGGRAPALGLSRLPGSGPEIEACAREWSSAPILLQGREATIANVRRIAQTRPGVMHFATHVLQDPRRGPDGFIAMSASKTSGDELLGVAEIRGWNVEGALIVLSGCSSGAGTASRGTGLMGMTRAWLLAGASAVVAATWPTPDDSGGLFHNFYRELRSSPGDAAGALQAAQLQMMRAGGWRSNPAYWGAYFISGNY